MPRTRSATGPIILLQGQGGPSSRQQGLSGRGSAMAGGQQRRAGGTGTLQVTSSAPGNHLQAGQRAQQRRVLLVQWVLELRRRQAPVGQHPPPRRLLLLGRRRRGRGTATAAAAVAAGRLRLLPRPGAAGGSILVRLQAGGRSRQGVGRAATKLDEAAQGVGGREAGTSPAPAGRPAGGIQPTCATRPRRVQVLGRCKRARRRAWTAAPRRTAAGMPRCALQARQPCAAACCKRGAPRSATQAT